MDTVSALGSSFHFSQLLNNSDTDSYFEVSRSQSVMTVSDSQIVMQVLRVWLHETRAKENFLKVLIVSKIKKKKIYPQVINFQKEFHFTNCLRCKTCKPVTLRYVQYMPKTPVQTCTQSRVAAVHINSPITLHAPMHINQTVLHSHLYTKTKSNYSLVCGTAIVEAWVY